MPKLKEEEESEAEGSEEIKEASKDEDEKKEMAQDMDEKKDMKDDEKTFLQKEETEDETIDVSGDVDALVKDEDLSEEFKSKAQLFLKLR